MRQWIRKYSLTPSWTVNLKILLDICVTVTFCPQLVFPIGKLEQDKWVWNDYPLYVMSTVSNSVKQCQTVSTVSMVIARCYLHLWWYFYSSKAAEEKWRVARLNLLDFPASDSRSDRRGERPSSWVIVLENIFCFFLYLFWSEGAETPSF